MIEYSKDDINYELAYDAHRGTSFKAEERAEQVQVGYVQEMDSVVEVFSKFITDENRNEINAAIEYYRDGYIQRLNAFLGALSRCMSPAIAGPSNYPVAQQEKRNNIADARRDEWLEWSKKAKETMRRRFDPIILACAPISSDDSNAIELLQVKVKKLEALQATMKAANKILRSKRLGEDQKTIQLGALGISKIEVAKLFVPDFAGRLGYPSYRLTNNNAVIRQTKKRIAQLERERECTYESHSRGCNTISENTDLNRLQLFFPGKPDEEMRAKLKANGFKWAPSQGAWQRKLNDNARYAVKRVLEDS